MKMKNSELFRQVCWNGFFLKKSCFVVLFNFQTPNKKSCGHGIQFSSPGTVPRGSCVFTTKGLLGATCPHNGCCFLLWCSAAVRWSCLFKKNGWSMMFAFFAKKSGKKLQQLQPGGTCSSLEKYCWNSSWLFNGVWWFDEPRSGWLVTPGFYPKWRTE